MSDPKTSQVPAQTPPEAPAELVARRDRIIRELESNAKSTSKLAALLSSTKAGFNPQVHQEVREAFSQQADEAGKNPQQAKVSPLQNEAVEWMEAYLKARSADPKATLSADLEARRDRLVREMESSSKSANKLAALLTSTKTGFDAKAHQEVREAFQQQADEASKDPQQARVSPILNEAVEWMEAYLKARGFETRSASPAELESKRERIIRELESNSRSASKMSALLASTKTGFDAKAHQEVREAFSQQADEAGKNPQARVSPILNDAVEWMESYLKARSADSKAALSADLAAKRERIARELESNAKSTSKIAALLSSTRSGTGFNAQVHQEVREAFQQQAEQASKDPQQARVSPILNDAVEWMESYSKARGNDPKTAAAFDLEARRHRIIRELESNSRSTSTMSALLTSTKTGFDAKAHQQAREAFSQQADEASDNPQQAKLSPILNEAVEWMESYLKARSADPKAALSAELESKRERIVRELESSSKSAGKMAALLTHSGPGATFDAKVHEEVREAFQQQADQASQDPHQARVSPILNDAVEWMQDHLKSRGAESKPASATDLDSRRERIIRELESNAKSASKMAALLTSTKTGFDAKVHEEVREAFQQQAEQASKNPQQARVSPILNDAVEWMLDYIKSRGASR